MPQEIVLCIFSIRNNKWASPKGLWNLSLELFAADGRERRFWFDFLSAVLQADQADLTVCCQWKGQSHSQLCSLPHLHLGSGVAFPWADYIRKPTENVLIFLEQFLKWIGEGNQLAERAFWVSIRCLTITKSSNHPLDSLCFNWFVENELFNILDKWKNKHLSRVLF